MTPEAKWEPLEAELRDAELALIRKLGCKPVVTSDHELVSRFPTTLTTLVFALIGRYAKQAYAERRKGRYLHAVGGSPGFHDAFAFIRTRTELTLFLNADVRARKATIVAFFRFAALLEEAAEAAYEKHGFPTASKRLLTNFDFRELCDIKAWIRQHYRREDLAWRRSLQASYDQNKDQWQVNFKEELTSAISKGEMKVLADVRRRYGSLGVSRAEQLAQEGSLHINAEGELALI